MNLLRRSGPQLALLILGMLGVADAIYLTLAHYDDQVPLVCSDSGFVNCSRVITSQYSYVPGTSLPITWPGLGWCLAVVALALLGIFLGTERRWLRVTQFVWAALGLLTVFYLLYAEIVKLDNLCAWCTVLHALIVIIFLITLTQLRGHRQDDDYDEEIELGDESDIVAISEPGRMN